MLHVINRNAAVHFIDRHIAEGRGRKTVFVAADKSVSYTQLHTETQRFANGLTRSGLRPGARMAMLMQDSLEFCIAFWGAIRAGIIPIPLNTLLPAASLGGLLADSSPDLLVISAEFSLPPNAPALVLNTGKDWEAFLVDGAAPPVPVEGSDIAFWLYSSGSTSAPKGVRHRHESLRVVAEAYAAHVLGMTESDIVLSAAKMFFAYGLGNSMIFPLAVGATAILWPHRPAVPAILELLQTHRPTLFFGVPTLYAGLVGHKDFAGADFSSLRLCLSAGEALPAALGQSWEAATRTKILDGIGSTEMLHIFLSNTQENLRYGSSGMAVPGYQLRIMGPHGDEMPDGEAGELLVHGPSAAADYWNQPQKSAATFVDGWTRTGDQYVRDADGFYHYGGRIDDVFKVSGIWVSPFEVESALAAHPAVLEAAMVAHADETGLLKPRAFVVLNDPEDASPELAEELQAFVKASIGPWKYPRRVEFCETLPKTATGKIQRFLLRQVA
jgi:benzoate-CoA ligase family protein